MAEGSPQNIPEDTLPAEAPVDELTALMGALKRNGFYVAVMAGAAIVAVLGTTLYRQHRTATLAQAAQVLRGAQTPKDLETLIADYGSTPYAPLASLKLAKAFFNAGEYDRAMEQYVAFGARHPQHALVDTAEMGRIYCLEAKGLTEEARSAFEEFAKKHPDHYLTAQACFGQARCLEQLGRTAQAKAVYEDFVAAQPENPWASRAEEALETLNRKLAAESETAEGPAAGVPAASGTEKP